MSIRVLRLSPAMTLRISPSRLRMGRAHRSFSEYTRRCRHPLQRPLHEFALSHSYAVRSREFRRGRGRPQPARPGEGTLDHVCGGWVNALQLPSVRIGSDQRPLSLPSTIRTCLFVWHVSDHRERNDDALRVNCEHRRDGGAIGHSRYAYGTRRCDWHVQVAGQCCEFAFACCGSGPVRHRERY